MASRRSIARRDFSAASLFRPLRTAVERELAGVAGIAAVGGDRAKIVERVGLPGIYAPHCSILFFGGGEVAQFPTHQAEFQADVHLLAICRDGLFEM